MQQMDHVEKGEGGWISTQTQSLTETQTHSLTGNNKNISDRTCSQQYVFAKPASEIILVTSRM